ncbi:MAG: carbohydrate-binding family 9-like protein [Sorangiineae bacterium]|nr:carbohydrate-binding family 9-like protein [Polyangiaceae bacterium]MEB2323528.1 carbohydrate-binding family 9-like protein [Sorangiineae bacterium]
MNPSSSRLPKSAALAFVAMLPTCHRGGPPGPAVERSDGALPELVVRRAAPGAIVVDGHADEPAWQRAPTTGRFVHPGTGKPAERSRVNAEARLLWDAEKLYVTVTVWDADAATPFSRDDVDPHVWERASGVELMLAPGDFADNRDYFELQIDPAGAVWDTRFDDYNRPVGGGRFGHQEWASGLERVTSRDERAGAWTVELALPWASVKTARAAPPAPGDVWRANLYSFRDGQRDALAWSPILGKGNFHRAARFGRLRFEAE